MSEPKFTPGPWVVDTSGLIEIVAPESFCGPHGDQVVVAEVCDDGEDTPKSLADARLIAAAPDLYAALREMRNAWCLNACDAASPDKGMNHLPECYAARDALAKAVGQ